MKKLFKNLKISLTFSSLLMSLGLFAKSPIAVVSSVRGEAFVTHNGRTAVLKNGQHLFNTSEVTTAVGAQVALNDYFDHRYHLAGGGHIKFSNRTIELKRGYFWIQSLGNQNQGFSVETANAKLNLAPGEGVMSFDPAASKTQFMSIKGHFTFANLQHNDLMTQVRTGQFSFVENDYEDGIPRNPTPVGEVTFKQVISLFPQVKLIDGATTESIHLVATSPGQVTAAPTSATRAPASVEGPAQKKSPMGHVIFLPLERSPDLVKDREALIESYQDQKVDKKTRPSRAPARVAPTSNVQVKVFGSPGKLGTKPAKANRAPASVKPTAVEEIVQQARKPASVQQQADAFESSLVDQYKKQMRHSDEVNELIKDLKNYEMDYNSGY